MHVHIHDVITLGKPNNKAFYFVAEDPHTFGAMDNSKVKRRGFLIYHSNKKAEINILTLWSQPVMFVHCSLP